MRGKMGGFITCPFIALNSKGNIDDMREHTSFLMEKGACALYSIGVVGEFSSMISDPRKKAAETIADEASIDRSPSTLTEKELGIREGRLTIDRSKICRRSEP